MLTSPTGELFFIDRQEDGDTYVIATLRRGVDYQFQVRAINAAGMGTVFTLSNVVTIPFAPAPTDTPGTSGAPGDEPTAEPSVTSTPVLQPTPRPTATPSPVPPATATATSTPGTQPNSGEGAETVTISLDKGWNLVSFQVLPGDRSIENVFASINGLYTEVNTISGGEVLVFTPGGDNTLTAVDPALGYWVRMKSSAALIVSGDRVDRGTMISLAPGWNLVPYLIEETWPVRLALGSIAGRYDEVRGFDGEAMSFFPALPSAFNTLNEMKPGEAYLVHMTESGQLVYP